jgi:hypothetical protein
MGVQCFRDKKNNLYPLFTFYLDPFAAQDALLPSIDKFNAAGHRLPWLENRRLVLSLTPQGEARASP